MILTQRDLKLLFYLSRYVLMTTKQINRTVFGNIAVTTVLRRLRALEANGYIQRIEGLANAERAWTVTLKGAGLAGDRQPKRHFNRSTLPHDVKLTDLRLSLEGHGIAHSWIAEHEIRSQMARSHGISRMQGKTVPDGIMGVDYHGVKHSVAIELELHFKSQGRYRDIFSNYRYKPNLWSVWYVVHAKSLGKHIDLLWRRRYGESSAPFFTWSLADEVIESPTAAKVHCYDDSFQIGKVWTPRAGNPPAHKDAHLMSGSKGEETAPATVVTHENQQRTLAQEG